MPVVNSSDIQQCYSPLRVPVPLHGRDLGLPRQLTPRSEHDTEMPKPSIDQVPSSLRRPARDV